MGPTSLLTVAWIAARVRTTRPRTIGRRADPHHPQPYRYYRVFFYENRSVLVASKIDATICLTGFSTHSARRGDSILDLVEECMGFDLRSNSRDDLFDLVVVEKRTHEAA